MALSDAKLTVATISNCVSCFISSGIGEATVLTFCTQVSFAYISLLVLISRRTKRYTWAFQVSRFRTNTAGAG